MALALFDLDHTLVSADTPTLWFNYLIDRGLAEARVIEPKIQRFTADYRAGTLDYEAYMRFELENLADFDMPTLRALREDFRAERIRPQISQKARDLLQKLRHDLPMIPNHDPQSGCPRSGRRMSCGHPHPVRDVAVG